MKARTKLEHPAVHEKEPGHLKVSEQCSLSVRLKDTSTVEGEQIRHPRKATEKFVSIRKDQSHGLECERKGNIG